MSTMRPDRSDAHLPPGEEAKTEEETRQHFQGIAPKRHTKPSRSDYSSVYSDKLPPSDQQSIPELEKLQRLEEEDSQKLVCNGNEVIEEYVETEYYKDLNCIDKQHHTTGTGFIKMDNSNSNDSSFHLNPDSDSLDCHTSCSCKGNPATNEWIPAADMLVQSTHQPESGSKLESGKLERMWWEEHVFFSHALCALYLMCPLTLLSLRFLTAPYGKHARPGWGPSLPPPLAWFLMESPTLWLTLLLYPRGRHRSHPLALLAISLFLLHYTHRTIIYPLRLHRRRPPTTTARFPLLVALIAFSYNLLNAYLQARSASHYAVYPPHAGPWIWIRTLAGVFIFFWGMALNVRSDLALVRLKAEGGGGYKIPRGGWFQVVSCPNYMGEAVEWLGWAAVAWSPAALGFFLYTCSNLVPRARAHLQWYRDKFGEEYPRSRKAIVPFIY